MSESDYKITPENARSQILDIYPSNVDFQAMADDATSSRHIWAGLARIVLGWYGDGGEELDVVLDDIDREIGRDRHKKYSN